MISETVRVALRMRDVGLSLAAARNYGVALNRVGLQKFVYLLDALSRVMELLPPTTAHETYKHGPYDRAIQNAVDCLCFRRLARIVRSTDGEQGIQMTDYSLTDSGTMWVSTCTQSEELGPRWDLTQKIAHEVEAGRNWTRLRELVYAEPTFVASRPKGFGQQLDVADANSASSGALLDMMRFVLTKGMAQVYLSPELLITLYFRYLDRYATQQRRWS